MIRILYVGAGDLARPSTGLDLASRCHFDEISADPRLSVDAISTSPNPIDPAIPAHYPVRQFASDMLQVLGAGARLRKKLALLARGGILFHSGLISDPARAALRAAFAAKPDVVVIDNISALGNVALLRLLTLRLRGRSRLLVIAHDATAEVMRDRASLQTSLLKAALLRLHALHCQLYETAVLTMAHRVVFLSRTDRLAFPLLPAAKTETLCLLLEVPPDSGVVAEIEPETALGQYLVFIGSPSFFANAFAIDWLERRFATCLQVLLPKVRIVLIGKGTDSPTGSRPDNMVGLGFLDEARLHRLLRGSCGLLSPVIHGSGIKIKVVEALASGCIVFATASSLRGYEFMDLDAALDIDDPAGSAARVAAIVGDPARLKSAHARIRDRWTDYEHDRQGKLADVVYRLGLDAGP